VSTAGEQRLFEDDQDREGVLTDRNMCGNRRSFADFIVGRKTEFEEITYDIHQFSSEAGVGHPPTWLRTAFELA
jgi:hypothetical protein